MSSSLTPRDIERSEAIDRWLLRAFVLFVAALALNDHFNWDWMR